jgi:hypothetical protein
MKKLLLTVSIIFSVTVINLLNAQELIFTKNGHISFFSSTPVEDIKANNDKVTSIIDTDKGDIQYSVLIMAFQFKKALMQEHFNENYMESGKFPKATFKGKITNLDQIDFSQNGSYPVEVAGKLTIRDVTKDIVANGTFEIKDGEIVGESSFMLIPTDYKY